MTAILLYLVACPHAKVFWTASGNPTPDKLAEDLSRVVKGALRNAIASFPAIPQYDPKKAFSVDPTDQEAKAIALGAAPPRPVRHPLGFAPDPRAEIDWAVERLHQEDLRAVAAFGAFLASQNQNRSTTEGVTTA